MQHLSQDNADFDQSKHRPTVHKAPRDIRGRSGQVDFDELWA